VNYAITMTGAPYSSQAPQTAYMFCAAALEAGHRIERLFLYGDAVLLASHFQVPPRDEPNWGKKWRELIAEHAVPATVCVASALRRGIIDEREARRHDVACANLTAPWEIAGLGDWVEMTQTADRHLLFSAST
jgi:tRNA 2-thiouridine synthesizing protein D